MFDSFWGLHKCTKDDLHDLGEAKLTRIVIL